MKISIPLLSLLGLLLTGPPTARAQDDNGLVATTATGQVRGQRVGGVLVLDRKSVV